MYDYSGSTIKRRPNLKEASLSRSVLLSGLAPQSRIELYSAGPTSRIWMSLSYQCNRLDRMLQIILSCWKLSRMPQAASSCSRTLGEFQNCRSIWPSLQGWPMRRWRFSWVGVLFLILWFTQWHPWCEGNQTSLRGLLWFIWSLQRWGLRKV